MSAAAHLDTLERRSLIALAAAAPDLAYIFRHVMAQDAVYASLVRRQRDAIHALVGEVLEQLYSSEAASPQLAALLGRHFRAAGEGARALPYLVRAGDHALSQYANREAADYYKTALEIAHGQPAAADLGHLYDARGQALERCGEYAAAMEGYEAMEAQAAAAADEALALQALVGQARLRSTFTPIANPIQGRALSERALGLAQQLGDGAAEARVLLYLQRLAVWGGDMPQVIALGERAVAAASAWGPPALLVEALNELAFWGYVNSMQLRLAGERLDEARALLPALAAPYQTADTLNNLIILGFLRGDYAAALRDIAELKRISDTLEHGWGQVQALMSAGVAYLEQGELGTALPLLEDGARLGNQFSIGHAARMTCGFLSRAYAAVGKIETGLAAVRQPGIAESRDPGMIFWAGSAETLLLLAAGRAAEAASAFERVRLQGSPTDVIAYRLLVEAEAELGLAQGDLEQVLSVTGRVIDVMRREGGRTILCEALAYRGRALLAAGNLEDARSTLGEARLLAEATGMRLVLWTVLAAQVALAMRQGQTAEAEQLRRDLHTLLRRLAADAGGQDRAAGFLAVPAVKAALIL